jgi:hypothetical protein
MGAIKVLARGFKFEINTGTDLAPQWVQIKGLTSFGVDSDKEDAETTDFESAGFAEHMVAGRSYEISLEGHFLEDAAGVRDPGQEEVDALAEEVGETSLGSFRMTTPKGKVWTWKASAKVGGPGGENNDPASWSATLTVSGKITKA